MNAALMHAAAVNLKEQYSTKCNAGYAPIVDNSSNNIERTPVAARAWHHTAMSAATFTLSALLGEDNLPVGATLTMRDKYTSVTVRRTGERSYNINGYETDHSGAPYDAQDALDFIFKWYGATTRHTITRP